MQQKHIPLRMCVVSREMLPKTDLIRIIKTDNGLKIDKSQKASGRGFWIKKDLTTIQQAKKKKALNRIVHGEVNEEFYLELEKMLNEK